MCGGLRYRDAEGAERRIFFPNPAAQLPARLRDGGIALLPWGRRREQAGRLPLGGWARLESIHAGRWARYQARPLIVPALGYMEKDGAGQSHWFELQPQQALQALLAEIGTERRLYIVTQASPPAYAAIHSRWPRLLDLSTS